MDKTSKKVMKYLAENNDIELFSYAYLNGECEKISHKLSLNIYDFKNCISYLVKSGYLSSAFTGNECTGFVINHVGLHYKEFEAQETRMFITNSIIVPVIVSFLTTLVANSLPALLSLIQELLQKC